MAADFLHPLRRTRRACTTARRSHSKGITIHPHGITQLAVQRYLLTLTASVKRIPKAVDTANATKADPRAAARVLPWTCRVRMNTTVGQRSHPARSRISWCQSFTPMWSAERLLVGQCIIADRSDEAPSNSCDRCAGRRRCLVRRSLCHSSPSRGPSVHSQLKVVKEK
jgi:hypothetical protein